MLFRARLALPLALLMMAGAPQSHALVSGYVRDADANPVAGALVTFTNESNSGEVYDAVTSATGAYQIDIATSVAESRPQPFALGRNYPNPFNPVTTIPYSLARGGFVDLSIYSITGQKIATLVNGHLSAGEHTAVWDGYASDGSHVAAGLYLYRLSAGGLSQVGKMTLLDGGPGGGVAGHAGMAMQIAKPASPAYRVTITGDEIEPYEQTGIVLSDGLSLDFTVARKAAEPVTGQYTMPLNIKETGQYFDFSTGTSVEALSPLGAWDVAFENKTMGLGIDLNFGKAARAMNMGSVDFAGVTLPGDLSDEDFILDAPWADTTAVAIDGWYDMPQMGVIESKAEVHIIASQGTGGVEYCKFQITGYADGVYSFRYAVLPDGETVTATVTKGGGENWKYYSFTDRAEIGYEPQGGSWDLYFGPVFFVMGEMGYMPVGTIIPNTGAGVEIAVVPDTALDEFVLGDWPAELRVMYEVPDWYTLSGGMPPTYEYPVQTVLVKTAENRYGVFQVLSYKSAGVTGFPTFDFTYNREE